MRDGQIMTMFNTCKNSINMLANQTQQQMQRSDYLFNNLYDTAKQLSVFVATIDEYYRKYWILPRNFYPGNKIFEKLFKLKMEMRLRLEKEAIAKQKLAQEEMMKKTAATTKENKKDESVKKSKILNANGEAINK